MSSYDWLDLEPSDAELEAIEAEWPVLEAEVAGLDAEFAAMGSSCVVRRSARLRFGVSRVEGRVFGGAR